jgi:hypothetical protein
MQGVAQVRLGGRIGNMAVPSATLRTHSGGLQPGPGREPCRRDGAAAGRGRPWRASCTPSLGAVAAGHRGQSYCALRRTGSRAKLGREHAVELAMQGPQSL